MVTDSEIKGLQVKEEKSNSEGELLHLVFGICLCPLDFANLFLLLFAVRPIKAEVERRHEEKGEASIAQIVFCVLDSAKLHLLFFTAVCVKEEAGR